MSKLVKVDWVNSKEINLNNITFVKEDNFDDSDEASPQLLALKQRLNMVMSAND